MRNHTVRFVPYGKKVLKKSNFLEIFYKKGLFFVDKMGGKSDIIKM